MHTTNVHGSTSDMKRAIFAATVTMSDELLPLFHIFKGAENSRITINELTTFPEMGFYAMQMKAWSDEAIMLKLIKNNMCLGKTCIVMR